MKTLWAAARLQTPPRTRAALAEILSVSATPPPPAQGAARPTRSSCWTGNAPGGGGDAPLRSLAAPLARCWTFWRDEWDFLLHRRPWSPGTFLDPFAEQLLAIPILIYKIARRHLRHGVGRPFQVVAVLLFLASVAMLFIYVRRRVGEWLALAAILPILFLGPSWDDLLFPFQMALFGCIACGIAALLMLERRDRIGDLAAMALLLTAPVLLRPWHPVRRGGHGRLAFEGIAGAAPTWSRSPRRSG